MQNTCSKHGVFISLVNILTCLNMNVRLKLHMLHTQSETSASELFQL